MNILKQIKQRQQVMSLDEIFTSEEVARSVTLTAKKIIDTMEDLITLSVTLQRMQRANSTLGYMSLTHPSVKESVTDIDRARADSIKAYYEKRLLLLTLQGHHLTKWRTDLSALLRNQTTKYEEKYMGMAQKLPYFYDYDISMDQLFENSIYAKVKSTERNGSKKLKFLRSMKNEQKFQKYMEYWFTDEQGDKHMMFFDKDNTLLPLFDRLIDDGHIVVDGTYVKRKKDNREFFVTLKYTFK
jgi:hypothetical protein